MPEFGGNMGCGAIEGRMRRGVALALGVSSTPIIGAGAAGAGIGAGAAITGVGIGAGVGKGAGAAP
jgi:hypothetical protein